jgi:hypothetical protein
VGQWIVFFVPEQMDLLELVLGMVVVSLAGH